MRQPRDASEVSYEQEKREGPTPVRVERENNWKQKQKKQCLALQILHQLAGKDFANKRLLEARRIGEMGGVEAIIEAILKDTAAAASSTTSGLAVQNVDNVRPLRPAENGEKRCYVKKNGLYQAYLWNPATKASTWQSTDYGGFSKTIRLSSLQDEGDCTGVFLAAKHDLFVLPHRDSMHKLHREECLATQDVPQISLAKKQILLLLKFEKAPWKTGAFGRRLNEAKQTVAQVVDLVAAAMEAHPYSLKLREFGELPGPRLWLRNCGRRSLSAPKRIEERDAEHEAERAAEHAKSRASEAKLED
ncbi:hypothetical protein AK812_SmicGene34237 [Symbiodinium microadriaticum]|uniref:Uncharacterized protein n=1 Tax=Symbiodinium microadriaticum TaxID=2951 RepID=A0A1Q9CPH7_SYMMI|nr:hypothetical protein AK812_SmicGene34237 [Symbiodinium microadriaticum]